MNEFLTLFYKISAPLTGYNEADLMGTGVGEQYLVTLLGLGYPKQGECIYQETSDLADKVKGYGAARDLLKTATVDEKLFKDQLTEPLVSNIISMWYTATWTALPSNWWTKYVIDASSGMLMPEHKQETFIVSSEGYRNGLIWNAMETHPMGAKQPGWGTWAKPPKNETL